MSLDCLTSFMATIFRSVLLMLVPVFSLNVHSSIVLLKNPDAISYALADAIQSAWVDHYGGGEEFFLYQDTHDGQAKALCTASQIKSASPDVYNHDCRVLKTYQQEHCSNSFGCIALEMSYEVMYDDELKKVLYSAIETPCEKLPESNRHPLSYYYPLNVSRKILNCGDDIKPYNKVILRYGIELKEVYFNLLQGS